MSDDLARIHQWADGILQQLSPAQRRTLARELGRTLRGSQQQRIASQQNPDGTAYAPRLRQKSGRIRRQMFAKLRTAQYLRIQATAEGVAIGFAGRVERIARVHQYGLRDRVRPGGPEVQYTARELLGFTEDDLRQMEDMVLAHIAR